MKLVLFSFMLALLLAGCRGNSERKAAAPSAVPVSAVQETVQFPAPRIPDFITGTDERMNYMLEHYWGAYDFNDTTADNRALGEQGFSNFLNLLQYADSAVAARSVKRYLSKGFAVDSLRPLYDGLIRHYLDNPNSPLRNDVLYAHFLREQLAFYAEDDLADRERSLFLLRMVSLNQSGQPAADFKFVDREGKRRTLYSVKSPLTLLIFNDPDCETCQAEMPRLLSDPLLQHEGLAVLAVYPDADTESWQSVPNRVPSTWIDAYSPGGEVVLRALYYLPAMPSLYLLDADKRVLLKDAAYRQVREYLAKRLASHSETETP